MTLVAAHVHRYLNGQRHFPTDLIEAGWPRTPKTEARIGWCDGRHGVGVRFCRIHGPVTGGLCGP